MSRLLTSSSSAPICYDAASDLHNHKQDSENQCGDELPLDLR